MRDALVLKSFAIKEARKNVIEALFCLQNWEIESRFWWLDGVDKILLSVNITVGVTTVWVIGTPIPSSILMSLLPLYLEWIDRFFKYNDVITWEASKFSVVFVFLICFHVLNCLFFIFLFSIYYLFYNFFIE